MTVESITILRSGPAVPEVLDPHGNPVPAADVEIVSEGWAVAPLTPDEDSLATGQSVSTGFTLYRRDVWVDVRPTDRVRVRGEVFAVTTAAALWKNPRSPQSGTVVTVRRVP